MADTFPENQWPVLCDHMKTGGPNAVMTYIASTEIATRTKLYHFARSAFGLRDWPGKNWDAYIAICRAGIDHMVQQKEIEDANLLSYNLACDLAPCWPGDDIPREQRHFETALDAAERCLHWRKELDKGPDPFAMAHWVKGIHLLALNKKTEAEPEFQTAFDYAVQEATSKNEPTAVTPNASESLLLYAAYNGLGKWIAGMSNGESLYLQAVSAFELKGTHEDVDKQDIQFYLDQLKKVRTQFL